MAPEKPEEEIKFPYRRIFDLFTRIDELLELNLEALRKLTKAIENLVLVVPPAVVPPVVAPKPVAVVVRYSGSDTDYQKIGVWRVGDFWGLERGSLKEIAVLSSNYSKTRFRFTVMGNILFKDLQIDAAMTLTFHPNVIPREKEIVLECKSSDGTAITVNGEISGVEY